jgi:hypothetical protein
VLYIFLAALLQGFLRTTFDFLNSGFHDIVIPLLCGGEFRYLSKPYLRPSRVDLL